VFWYYPKITKTPDPAVLCVVFKWRRFRSRRSTVGSFDDHPSPIRASSWSDSWGRPITRRRSVFRHSRLWYFFERARTAWFINAPRKTGEYPDGGTTAKCCRQTKVVVDDDKIYGRQLSAGSAIDKAKPIVLCQSHVILDTAAARVNN